MKRKKMLSGLGKKIESICRSAYEISPEARRIPWHAPILLEEDSNHRLAEAVLNGEAISLKGMKAGDRLQIKTQDNCMVIVECHPNH